MIAKFAALAALVAGAAAQQACSLTTETHPSMSWSKCTSGGQCTKTSASVTIDANWRWLHSVSGSTNCYTGNTWDSTLCSSATTCASNCCVDGAAYGTTYGASTSGDALTLKLVTKHEYGSNIGSRLYLMENDTKYQMFNLLGNEFTFDVDVSNAGCGINGALYFVSMDADGGMAKYNTNKAGAKYGTGYCDAQCPRDLKFINGLANVEGWEPSDGDKNAGAGPWGSCCSEMDIWEANSISTAFTPHPCTTIGQERCSGNSCGGTYSNDRYGGTCDADGCDFNSYRQGNTSFYGKGKTVDTSKKLTVVTQFYKNSAGELSEIKRFYVQDGKIIPNSESTISGVPGNSITSDFCDAQKTVFGDIKDFQKKGGLTQMGRALEQGMVLVMSIWDDHHSNMLWLDSTFPVDRTGPGAARGECPTTGGSPADVEANAPNSSVTFSNIRFGPINSTVAGLGSVNPGNGGNPGQGTTTSSTVRPTTTSTRTSTTSTRTSTTSTAAPTPTNVTGADHWQQCGGQGFNGPTTCKSPYTCTVINQWYHQCL